MSSLIDKKYFKYTFFLLILAEILSYLGWMHNWVNAVCFVAIILTTLFLSLSKLEYGLYILLAELFIGSKGYLFSLNIGDTVLSVRMGIFMVVVAVFLVNVILRSVNDEGSRDKQSKTLYKINSIFRGIPRPALIAGLGMTIIIGWAFIWGIIRGNNFGNVFLDFNNWLYFLIALPIIYMLKIEQKEKCHPELVSGSLFFSNNEMLKQVQHDKIKNIISIMAAAVSVIFLKTIFLFYIFTHQISFFLPEIYKWVRDTNVGEITHVAQNVWRVFMPAQIYSLIAFFILLIVSRKQLVIENKKNKFWSFVFCYLLLVFCLATLIISFSRSFWVGLLAGLVGYLLWLLVIKEKFINILKQLGKIILFLLISLILASAIYFLPPKPTGDWASILGQRLTQGEAASSARLNQLSPLWQGIKKHPLIGSGFGTTITYFSSDPRLINETAGQTGEVTTYASEWGYLDMILKLGAVGVAIYLYIIFSIMGCLVNFKFLILNQVQDKFLNFKINQKLKIQNNQNDGNHNTLYIIHYTLFLGLALALVALLAVNIFSPYLNHPLGIGFVLITFSSIFFTPLAKEDRIC